MEIIKTCYLLECDVIELGDNYIEVKMIGSIFVTNKDDYVEVELGLKNNRLKKLFLDKDAKNTLIDIWLKETSRRKAEAERCGIPRESKPERNTKLSDVIIEGVLERLEPLLKNSSENKGNK